MGGWSCYWTLPRLDMRIKDKSRLSARKGWKGTKSQCVQIPRIITQSKTTSLRPCPNFAFLPLVQALTPREQVNPDEAWWGSRAALQLHHMGWVSAGSQPHLNGNKCCDATIQPLAMGHNSISHGGQQNKLSFPTDKRGACTQPSMASKRCDAQMPKSWNRLKLLWSNWFLA